MQNIGGFFEKFRNRAAQQVGNLIFILAVIQKHTGIMLGMKDVSVGSGIIRIKASPAAKSEIFMKKQRILSEIQEKLKPIVIEDIR